MQILKELKCRALFGDSGVNDDFDDENDWEDEELSDYHSFDPDSFSRRELMLVYSNTRGATAIGYFHPERRKP